MFDDDTPSVLTNSYPNYFPVKIIGNNSCDFSQQIIDLLTSLKVSFDNDINTSFSKSSNYISLTINIYILSREHFSYIYNEINRHSLVKFVI